MKNYIEKGNTVEVVAPSGGLKSGVPKKIGDKVVIPITSGEEGEIVACSYRGVFELPTASSFTPLKSVYLTSAGNVVDTASGNTLIGTSWSATEGGKVKVNLNS